MSRPGWTGRKASRAVAYVVNRDNGICGLCGHDGANSCDHVLPVSVRPDLEWDPSNWIAAHHQGAGADRGCPVTGCHCTGNVGRNNAPLDTIRRLITELNNTTDTSPPSRDW